MNRTPVNSTNIRSLGYEQETRTLEVEFHNGGLYQYAGVPDTIYRAFMRAASKGSFLYDQIRDRYHCVKVR